MTLADFTQALITRCEQEASAANVRALLAKAWAQIDAGNGTLPLNSSASANGKSFNQTPQFTALQTASACQQALDLYGEVAGASPFTSLDFSTQKSPYPIYP